MMSSCIWKPEYVCNRDCRVRNFRCGFDEEFRKECIGCVNGCKKRYGLDEDGRFPENYSDYRSFESCVRNCAG